MAASLPRRVPILFLFIFLSFFAAVTAIDKVPVKDRFREVNQGEFSEHSSEYFANYRALVVYGNIFQLAFYNTTPNSFMLGIRMGVARSESLRRWVWQANRNRPVRENATVFFGADGNLVLADADGTVVWSTGTANKGVVGITILDNGNMVLYDKKGRYLWQSFDYPTDTLLVGQSLPTRGAAKLVSRRSATDASPGIYSLAVDSGDPILYVDASPKPVVYYNSTGDFGFSRRTKGPLTFEWYSPDDNVTFELSFGLIRTVTKYDSIYSFLRLTPDGDLVIYTYDDRVDYKAWEKTFVLFDADTELRSACYKAGRCGAFGLCEREMCTGCPTPKGTTGWSDSCAPPKRGPCRPGASSSYYKVAAVEHFITVYRAAEGVVSVGECRRRCNADCNCLGFLYWEESSQCWLAPVLSVLKKVANPRHVAYIKSS
ncbi:unnamed protein product [Spirodela intermedia]|uniref:Uncharacterized protein n=1 Tax=Spirodela intermedia TaxID=51605 RepID=A0A7I8K8P2_SPIIN|nr:unnamed protein product [Spirodela intermedia]